MKLVQHKAEVDPAVIKALAGALLGGGAGFMLGGRKKKLLPTLVGAGIGAVGGATVQQLLERAAYTKEQNSLGNKVGPYANWAAYAAVMNYGPKIFGKIKGRFGGKVPGAPPPITTGFVSPELAAEAPMPTATSAPKATAAAPKVAPSAVPKAAPTTSVSRAVAKPSMLRTVRTTGGKALGSVGRAVAGPLSRMNLASLLLSPDTLNAGEVEWERSRTLEDAEEILRANPGLAALYGEGQRPLWGNSSRP